MVAGFYAISRCSVESMLDAVQNARDSGSQRRQGCDGGVTSARKVYEMFGYDPNKVNPELKEVIDNYGEAMLYFHINTAGGVRHRVSHSSAHQERPGSISVKDSISVEEEMFHEQRYCIEALKTKGIVEKPITEDGSPTDDYWTWFRVWDRYVKNLSGSDWAEFEKALNANEDVSQWRPPSDAPHAG